MTAHGGFGMFKTILVGYGKFGREYYSELLKLERLGLHKLVGVVTKNSHVYDLKADHTAFIESELTNETLEDIDLAIIVTPGSSHLNLIKRFIAHCNVVVEKPIVDSEEALLELEEVIGESKYNLIPAQIFRYNPLSQWFKTELSGEVFQTLQSIEALFVNGDSPTAGASAPLLEMNHLFDLVCYFFGELEFKNRAFSRRENLVSMDAIVEGTAKLHCSVTSGWSFDPLERKRELVLYCENMVITLDFISNLITIEKEGGHLDKTIFNPHESNIFSFLKDVLDNKKSTPLIAPSASASISILKKLIPPKTAFDSARNSKPRVAVLGGGVFGATTALELSDNFDVKVYESQPSLLSKASYWNQWRHHSGFHYPLSHATVDEIVKTKAAFEEEYSEAIRFDIPSFYFVASNAREIPAERYLSTCDLYNLNYNIVAPPSSVRDSTVSLSLLTDEGIYNIKTLQDILTAKINSSAAIDLALNCKVTSVSLDKNNRKIVSSTTVEGIEESSEFDYVVDCSNATANVFSEELKPAAKSVKYEVVELLELELELSAVCLTVIDGPFVSLTSMGDKNKFLLSHRDHSVLKRFYSEEPPNLEMLEIKSNRENILNEAKKYFSCLENVKNIKSFISMKSISPYQSEVWERPTIIRNHKFGVVSVIGGKILTSVENAKEVRAILEEQLSTER